MVHPDRLPARKPRWRGAALVAIVIGVFALGWSWRAPPAGRPAIAAASCHRLALVDATSGEDVLGAEDIALDRGRERLLVSAYDRLGAEAGRKARGGLYAVPLEALSRSAVRVTPIALGPGRVPHGISLGEVAGAPTLAVIERRYHGGRPPLVALSLYRIQDDGALALQATFRDSRLCSANDLALLPGPALAVSLDRGFCENGEPGGGDGLLVQVAWPDGARAMVAPLASKDTLVFPNGVAALPQDRIAVADTRGGAVWLVDRQGRSQPVKLRTPGGPDNLTLEDAPSGEPRLLAALHPSLMRIALHRYDWPLGRRAPSRIIRLNPADGRIELLFDDRDGTTWSGATVAVEANGWLVAGAIREPGLLACPLARST